MEIQAIDRLFVSLTYSKCKRKPIQSEVKSVRLNAEKQSSVYLVM